MVQPLVVKFAGLVIKTLTKPVANQIKAKASEAGWIRSACFRYGQLHHKLESRAILRVAGHDAKSIKPIQEDAAVSIGATVFSELFIFTVGGAVLLWELNKKAQDDDSAKAKKDALAAREKRELEQRFHQLEGELRSLGNALKDAEITLHRIKMEQEAAAQQQKKKGWIL